MWYLTLFFYYNTCVIQKFYLSLYQVKQLKLYIMITKEDIINVGNSIGITDLTKKEVSVILNEYPSNQENGGSTAWNLVVENQIREILLKRQDRKDYIIVNEDNRWLSLLQKSSVEELEAEINFLREEYPSGVIYVYQTVIENVISF